MRGQLHRFAAAFLLPRTVAAEWFPTGVPKKRSAQRPPEFVTIAYVERPHGVRGGLRLRVVTDHPEQLHSLDHVFLTNREGVREKFRVMRARVQGGRIYLDLEELKSREQAAQWRGASVEIPGASLPPLEEGEYYAFELIGLKVVTTQGEEVGVLAEVLDMPANDVYVVRKGEKEHLIPAIKDVVKEVDLSAGRMVIEAIEGLLD